MQRRDFLSTSVTAMTAGMAISSNAVLHAEEKKTQPSTGNISVTGILFGHPVVSGPAPESLTILQAVNGPASGYVELAVGGADFQRVDAESAGLLPYDAHVLKFVLPPLPANETIRYRIVARSIQFKTDYNILQGEPETSATRTFRTLNPQAATTKFVVWNDTHENQQTTRQLQALTDAFQPDFLFWNGDQTNNVHDAVKMREQFLSPGGLDISSRWPLGYLRGNHELRGPGARQVKDFTGTPADQFYYGFRSGPVAILAMDTGEDKPDDRAVFAGLASFEVMRQRQRAWLAQVIKEPWFTSARYRLLFCHIPLWWYETPADADFWYFSPVCRDAWLPLLQQAGIQLVISGHTHRATWLPSSSDQPIGQLIGGGPKPEAATIIEGMANETGLTLTSKSLAGKILHRVEI